MNKTVTINISGIIFHIEEDAFEKLSKYLSTIKGYFSKTDGGNEIMGDIEARIAEMLQGKTNATKQVVLMQDVDSVIEVMGKPEEFIDENPNSESENQEEANQSFEQTKKRMFRDPDNKAIGGVCSGIAAYFDVDLIWIRLAMFLLIFFGGVSLWVYIILWIVIPEAKTTADKLAMRGEKIDINNISKTVKEEAEQLKKRMEKYGNDLKDSGSSFKNNNRNFFDKLGDFIKEFMFLFGRVFARLVGLVLVIFGLIFMFSLLTSIFGFSIAGSNTEFNDWINLIFLERSHYTLGKIGVILLFAIPILGIIYGGIKLLLKIRYKNRWLNLGMGVVWLIGLFIVIYIGVTTGKEFSSDGKIKDQYSLVQKDTLYLTLNDNQKLRSDLQITEESEKRKRYFNKRHVVIANSDNSYYIGKNQNGNQIVGHAELNIVPASGDQFEMIVVKKSRGETREIAADNAKAIKYNFEQQDSLLVFDELFTVNPNEKFRVQQVKITLKVPRNKVIYLDNSLASFIYDVENLSNTYDREMVGRRWIMTKDGLACIDCDGLEKEKSSRKNDDDDDDNDESVEVDHKNGNVKVDVKNANVKIDENGINIKSEDANVNINNGNIHIENKKPKKGK
ncbi:MAG: PspC domain-containing protein [Sphingobacteriaceae bacterium]|nr:PspC domain-containing protein [Sphingobacteriaceae bacterium]